jgi:sortase A
MYIPPNNDTGPDTPVGSSAGPAQDNAVDLIREKLSRIYSDEPNAAEEAQEAEHVQKRSKHQQFMHELSSSGKDLATIQTEWHNYYQSLPPHEKHQVWHEFYASQSSLGQQSAPAAQPQPALSAPTPKPHQLAVHKHEAKSDQIAKKRAVKHSQAKKLRDVRTPDEIKATIKDKVSAGGKLQAKHHLQSLLFGLAMGSVVLVVFLFSFFNEVIVAPFIQPSRAQAATPIIVDNTNIAVDGKTEVIIPKINVQIPVDYTQNTTDESQIENALDSAVVHYPTTVKPGETGNAAYFGHSSNNIFNKGKYKFAFVMLHTLVPGDTFYLTYNNKAYVYKVISRTVVDPSEVGVLGPVAGHPSTATLITCDPPGTSLKRLIVVGEQISPDPSGNTQAVAPTQSVATSQSATLPGNGPTLLGRVLSNAFGKLVLSVAIIGIGLIMWRQILRSNQQPA